MVPCGLRSMFRNKDCEMRRRGGVSLARSRTCLSSRCATVGMRRRKAGLPGAAASAGSRWDSCSTEAPLGSLGAMPVVFRSPPEATADLCGFGRQVSAGAAVSPTVRILCYGDSLTAGYCSKGRLFEPYGRTLASCASEALAAGPAHSSTVVARSPAVMDRSRNDPCCVTVAVCGHSGETASGMVAGMDAAAIGPDAAGFVGKGIGRILQEDGPQDIVLIMAGTNDLGRGASVANILRDLAQLHAACHKAGVATVALAPPPAPQALHRPCAAEREQLVRLMREWAAMVDMIHAFIDPAELIPCGVAGSRHFWEPDGLHLSPRGSKLLGRKLASAIASLPLPRHRATGLYQGMACPPVSTPLKDLIGRASSPLTTTEARGRTLSPFVVVPADSIGRASSPPVVVVSTEHRGRAASPQVTAGASCRVPSPMIVVPGESRGRAASPRVVAADAQTRSLSPFLLPAEACRRRSLNPAPNQICPSPPMPASPAGTVTLAPASPTSAVLASLATALGSSPRRSLRLAPQHQCASHGVLMPVAA